jgi:hypothetical protein
MVARALLSVASKFRKKLKCMKKVAVFTFVCLLIIFALAIIIWLATPRDWPMTSGTIKAKKVTIEGNSFIMVEGEPMNYLGQIQSINLDFDDTGIRIVVTRCLIRWNPFSKIIVNNQWPVFYPLEGVKPGKYSVVYRSAGGEVTAGYFDVP